MLTKRLTFLPFFFLLSALTCVPISGFAAGNTATDSQEKSAESTSKTVETDKKSEKKQAPTHRSAQLLSPYKEVWGVHPEYISTDVFTEKYFTIGLFYKPTSNFISGRDWHAGMFLAPYKWLSFSCRLCLSDLMKGVFASRPEGGERSYFKSQNDFYNYTRDKREINVIYRADITCLNRPSLSIDLGCFASLPIASRYYEETRIKNDRIQVGAALDLRKKLFNIRDTHITGTLKIGYTLFSPEFKKEYSYIVTLPRTDVDAGTSGILQKRPVHAIAQHVHSDLYHAFFASTGLHVDIKKVKCSLGYSAEIITDQKIETRDGQIASWRAGNVMRSAVLNKEEAENIKNPVIKDVDTHLPTQFKHSALVSLGRSFTLFKKEVTLVGNLQVQLPDGALSRYSVTDNWNAGLRLGFKF